MPTLRHAISFASNDIEIVDFEIPASVRMLELGNNQIKKVGQSLFKNGKNLDQLYLHSNILKADGIPSMRRLRKLLRLTLGDNQMTRIPRLPRSVERVNLRDNKFEGVLPRKSLSSLRHLQELILIRVQIANK